MTIRWRTGMAVGIALLSLSTTLLGQEVVPARITGTITDDTGGAMPGVSVTLTSPALQVPQVVQVSDAQGEYKFLDLRPGTYRLAYELAGFNSLVREGIILTTGFAARVDVGLKLGSVAETITVSGASPVVDVVNTRGGVNVSNEVIETIPNSKALADIASLAGAAVQYRGAPIQGEAGERVTLAESSGTLTYGQSSLTNIGVEGIKAPINEAMDWNVAEEVDLKSYGNGAEQDGSGVRIGLIVKSGGNDFHGSYRVYGQSNTIQSSNIDATDIQNGLTSPDSVKWYYDLTGDLGGRIIRDKLWFYGALRGVADNRLVAGSCESLAPNGVYGPGCPEGEAPAHTRNQMIKVSYQATSKHRFIGFFMRDNLIDETEDSLSRFIPFESTAIFRELGKKGKVAWDGLFGPRLLASALVGTSGYEAWRYVQPVSYGIASQLDRATGQQTGATFGTLVGNRVPNSYPQMSGNLTYLPRGILLGTHKVTIGGHVEWREFDTNFPASPGLDYQQQYNTIGGVAHTPFQLVTVNRPLFGVSRQNVFTFYGSDEWRATKRLTMNVGARWERHNNWVPAQSREAGAFSAAATFPELQVGTWHDLVGRFGAAYDLFGNGKTVAKGTYGRYYQIIDVSFANALNKNTITTTTYLWHDLNHDGLYQPGEVNLDLNGADFVSIAGANVNVVAPDSQLQMPYTDELTFSLERELWSGVAIRGLYLYKNSKNLFANVNILRPFNVYNQVFTRVNPGPDGIPGTADDAGPITIYDYDPAYRGANFVQNMNVNAPSDRFDYYNNFEVALNKRSSGRYLPVSVSFLATKNHRWLTTVAQSPNDNLFPLDETWAYATNVTGGYRVPFGIMVSGQFRAYSGVPGQQTYLFAAKDPSGGPSFPSSTGGLTLRTGQYGAVQAPARYLTNIRASKDLALGRNRRLRLDLDVLNLFNTNVPWSSGADPSISFLEGPTYGLISRITTPRVARLGASFTF